MKFLMLIIIFRIFAGEAVVGSPPFPGEVDTAPPKDCPAKIPGKTLNDLSSPVMSAQNDELKNSIVSIGYYLDSKKYKGLNVDQLLQDLEDKKITPQQAQAAMAKATTQQFLGEPIDSYRAYCTGSVIHPRVILTAAHCLKKYMGNPNNTAARGVSFYVGASTTFNNDVNTPISNNHIKVADHAIAKDYELEGTDINGREMESYGDVGLIFLDHDLPAPYAPIALPAPNQTFVSAERMRIYGYNFKGTKGDLRYTETSLFNPAYHKVCPDIFQEIPWLLEDFNKLHLSEQQKWKFLNTYLFDGRAPCGGSSGGPMPAKVNGKWVQFGVFGTINGSESCTSTTNDDLIVGTRSAENEAAMQTNPAVASYVPWIQQELRKRGLTLPAN